MIPLPTITFCPATMCPLFAKDGSPWSKEKNAVCQKTACSWWGDGKCDAAGYALDEVAWESPDRPPRTFNCPREAECQWQRDTLPALCPPRAALAAGIDPKNCAY